MINYILNNHTGSNFDILGPHKRFSEDCLLKRPLLFILCFIAAAPAFIPAQTAAELEAVLDNPAVTCAQAAWFTLAAAPPDYDLTGGAEGAFKTARGKGWLPREAAADDPVRLGTLSFLIMKAFDIKGGLMYTLLPGERYAFRTMVSRSLIQGAADPAMTVSGERFLHILGNVLELSEGGE